MIRGVAALVKCDSKSKLAALSAHYVVGAAIGGALAFAAISVAFAPVRNAIGVAEGRWVVLLVALAAVLGDFRLIKIPRIMRQVPQKWYKEYGPRRAYFAYGTLLGAGFATFVPYAALYVLASVAAFRPVLGAAVLGALFGVSRGVTVLYGFSQNGRKDELAGALGRLYMRLPGASVTLSVLMVAAF